MDNQFIEIKEQVYDNCNFVISGYKEEPESKEYNACRFELNGCLIISRSSKITPKKVGQFVTFLERNNKGFIEPFQELDEFDFVVNVIAGNKLGQFVFPKHILKKKGIISTTDKEGKRAIRVYPSWVIPTNATAQRTQKWQLDYFFELSQDNDHYKVKELYNH